MGKFFKAVKAAASAAVDSLGPGRYSVAGRQVHCGHCGGVEFRRNVVSLIGESHALTCEACTHVELFGQSPDRL